MSDLEVSVSTFLGPNHLPFPSIEITGGDDTAAYTLDDIREAYSRGVLLGWGKAVHAYLDMFQAARSEIVAVTESLGMQVTADPPSHGERVGAGPPSDDNPGEYEPSGA